MLEDPLIYCFSDFLFQKVLLEHLQDLQRTIVCLGFSDSQSNQSQALLICFGFYQLRTEVIVELIGYLSGVSYSFIEDLDAFYVFCLFLSNVNEFPYLLPSFEKVQFISLKKNIKVVGLTLSSQFKDTLFVYFNCNSQFFSFHCIFSSTHLFVELIFLIQSILVHVLVHILDLQWTRVYLVFFCFYGTLFVQVPKNLLISAFS